MCDRVKHVSRTAGLAGCLRGFDSS
jgi:hypothetical protein